MVKKDEQAGRNARTLRGPGSREFSFILLSIRIRFPAGVSIAMEIFQPGSG
jgi:hypothetical protein